MLKIKRLDTFVLRSFLPLFAMTFFIVLFIVLMQFLWKYIDDLVGKGLSIDVLAELFFYAAVTMVPMALPLAILLASLMTFGNLGEKFELTAMKASGISLVRVMAPLIVLVSGIAVGAFFFQNDVLPRAQVKMWTLLFSVRQKSPEVEIPEGVFYDQIPGYNLFVDKKDKESGMLHNVIIYDVGQYGTNSTIMRADSARLAFTKGMTHLYLHMWKGEQFENLKDVSAIDQNVPFRRETFFDKEILIPFDANFNRLDEEGMRRQYVGKNISELNAGIDSLNQRLDSIGKVYSRQLLLQPLAGVSPDVDAKTQSAKPYVAVKMPAKPPQLDSLLSGMDATSRNEAFSTAAASLARQRQSVEFQAQDMADEKKVMRRHEIELLKKYTLSVACLIFFFVGAPLGAIIRKGGLATPLVISVLLFIVYYIIDNTGYKMARDGRMIVWIGIWLSSFIMAPLGIYVTWKAMNDSAVFDKDAYLNLLRRWLGIKASRKVELKEVIINDIDNSDAVMRLRNLRENALAYKNRYHKVQSYYAYWMHGYDIPTLNELSTQLDEDVAYMRDCSDKLATAKLLDYPVLRSLWLYHPARNKYMAWAMMVLFPIGLPLWLMGIKAQSNLKKELTTVADVSKNIIEILDPSHFENPKNPGNPETFETPETPETPETQQPPTEQNTEQND